MLHISLFYSAAYILFWFSQKTYYGFECWTLATICYTCIFGATLLRFEISQGLSIGAVAFFVPLSSMLYADGILRFIQDKKLPWYAYLTTVFAVCLNLYFYYVDNNLAMRSAVLVVSIAPSIFMMCRALFSYNPRTGRPLYLLGGGFFVMRFVGLAFGSAILFIQKDYNNAFVSPDMGAYLLFTLIAVLGVGLFFFLIHSHRSQETLYAALVEATKKNGKTLS
jgi:hypothetical protein